MISIFTCPLSSEVFETPVIAADGFTYEKSAIEMWILEKGGLAPSPMMSSQLLSLDTLTPNILVSSIKDDLIRRGVDVSEQLTRAAAQYLIDDSAAGGTSLIMSDPVVFSNGFTYERTAVEEWTLFPDELIPNRWYMELVSIIRQHLHDQCHEKKSSPQQVVPPTPPVTVVDTIAPELEEMLCCPISLEIMRDPVLAVDGFTYERKYIENWVELNGSSPMTAEPMEIKDLMPNILVRQIIEFHFPLQLNQTSRVAEPSLSSLTSLETSVTSDDAGDNTLQHISSTRRKFYKRTKKLSGVMKTALKPYRVIFGAK